MVWHSTLEILKEVVTKIKLRSVFMEQRNEAILRSDSYISKSGVYKLL